MMTDMRVNIAGVELKNPVMTASGTFGSGEEYSEFVDLNRLGRRCDERRGKRALAGKRDSESGRDLRRHDERHRPSEPRASTFSAREIFPSFRNMTRRSSSTSAVMRRKNIWLWLNGWQRKRSI